MSQGTYYQTHDPMHQGQESQVQGKRTRKQRLRDYQIEQRQRQVVYVAWLPCIEDTHYRHQ